VRNIESEIEWKTPLISVRGSRGIGKNTMLLQYIKLHHKPDGSVLYASADNIEYGSGNHISLRMFGFLY